MLLNLVWLLGVYLLYAAPIMVFLWEPLLKRVSNYVHESAMPLSIGLVIFMMWALNIALYVFVFYFALYWVTQYLLVRWGAPYSDSLILPVYMCFAVSVLWEWPIQLTIPQHFDSLFASSFKALGIPLLILHLRRRKWRPSTDFIILIIATVLIGFSIAGFISIVGIISMFWTAHLYRVPWIIIMLIATRESYINTASPAK